MEKELLNTFDKELLLKDLCARLPYGVKVNGVFLNYNKDKGKILYEECVKELDYEHLNRYETLKPYLFPLSSMTEEQKKEISKGYNLNTYGLCIEITNHSEGYWDDDSSCNLQDYLWLIDWFNKNHFDYRGLIEKSLALDATNLGIYE